MFITSPEAPPASVESTAMIATRASTPTPTYGVCAFASNTATMGNELSPFRFLLNLLPKAFTDRLKFNDLSQQEWDWLGNWDEHLAVQVLSRPQHGKVDGTMSPTYFASQGYTGKDRVPAYTQP